VSVPERVTAVTEAQALWSPEGPYLNTASYGLPPANAWDELQSALADWRGGRTSWEPWGEYTHGARAAFARIVGVPPEWVAISGTVSELVGLVAAATPDGCRVVAPDIEFTSLVWPFLAHADRGVQVETVPLAGLLDAIDSTTDVVAVSAAQSSNGELADLAALTAAAHANDAVICVDATQAVGWLPIDATDIDFLACAAYKWLCSPRGTAFLSIRPEHAEYMRPLAAGWWAADDPHSWYYGTPLHLAPDMRRFDTSPAWFSWVGAQPTLETLERIGIEAIQEHDVALANRFRAGLGMPPGDSAIVSADVPGAQAKLARAGIQAATRDGGLRASFHVYNTESDVDRALEALVG
jgi:selenocysteine lyase/cysteine desulfurase